MVHRDIKPENIVVAEEDHDLLLKLVDFDASVVVKNDCKRRLKAKGTKKDIVSI